MENRALAKKKNDGRHHRADGERSRHAILHAASKLATVEGLDGLSIARLAEHVGMSKSGLFAHFKSKEELQLATIDTAKEIFDRDVVAPALAATAGVQRILAFCEAFFSYLERRVFPGGCFFASVSSELEAKPGPVRDHTLAVYRQILGQFTEMVQQASDKGELEATEDVGQLTFELASFLRGVNSAYSFFQDPAAITRGREAIRLRLERAKPADGAPKRGQRRKAS